MVSLNKKGVYIFYASVIILLLIIIVNIKNDYYINEFKETSLTFSDEYLESKNQKLEYRGIVSRSPELVLNKGKYTITIKYETDSPNNYFEILAGDINDGNNNIGKIYYTGEFNKGLAETSVHITLDQDVREFAVRTYCDEGNLRIVSNKIESDSLYSTDTILLIVLTIILSILVRAKLMKIDCHQTKYFVCSNKKKMFCGIVLIGIGVIASFPMFNDIIYNGHDASFHLTRIEGIKAGISGGQFPVHINPTFAEGYGYINSIMYPELFLYIPAGLRLLGVSLTLSYKIFCILMNISSAFFGYYCIKRLTKSENIGLLFSIIFTLSNYRFINLYLRMALGEWLAMLFIPLVVLGIYELLLGDENKWWYSVIGITCIFQSHILTTEMCLILIFIVAIVLVKRLFMKSRIKAIIKAIVLTLLLNAWTIVPFLYYYRWDLLAKHDLRQISEEAVYISQLFSSFVYGTSNQLIGSTLNEMPQSLGVIIGFGCILFICENIFMDKIDLLQKKIGWSLLGLGAITVYMASTLCPWHILSKLPIVGQFFSIMQFPCRWLGMATVMLSGVTAIAIHIATNKIKDYIIIIATCIVCILFFGIYADNYLIHTASLVPYKNNPQFSINEVYQGQYYENGTNIDELFLKRSIADSSENELVICNFIKKGLEINFTFHNNNNACLDLPLYYYIGYHAILVGEGELDILQGDDHRVRIILPNGIDCGNIRVFYIKSILFKIGEYVTVITIISILILILFKKRKSEEKNHGSIEVEVKIKHKKIE